MRQIINNSCTEREKNKTEEIFISAWVVQMTATAEKNSKIIEYWSINTREIFLFCNPHTCSQSISKCPFCLAKKNLPSFFFFAHSFFFFFSIRPSSKIPRGKKKYFTVIVDIVVVVRVCIYTYKLCTYKWCEFRVSSSSDSKKKRRKKRRILCWMAKISLFVRNKKKNRQF